MPSSDSSRLESPGVLCAKGDGEELLAGDRWQNLKDLGSAFESGTKNYLEGLGVVPKHTPQQRHDTALKSYVLPGEA